jgi:hypothetical protein
MQCIDFSMLGPLSPPDVIQVRHHVIVIIMFSFSLGTYSAQTHR